MIKIRVLNNNNIVTLEIDGKNPIKSSGFGYTANELICSALGSCIGRMLVLFANEHSLRLEKFEYFGVGMEDRVFKVLIKHPTSLSENIKNDLITRINNCEIATLLKDDIDIILMGNEISDEEISRIASEKKPCCGG